MQEAQGPLAWFAVYERAFDWPTLPAEGYAALRWQSALQRYFEGLSPDEAAQLRAEAVKRLDRATRARRLEVDELARLSALADYLAPRIERREGAQPPTLAEGVLIGLMAGYQLSVGEQAGLETDPFDD